MSGTRLSQRRICSTTSTPSPATSSEELIMRRSRLLCCRKERRMPVLSDDSMTSNPWRSSDSFKPRRRTSSRSAIKITRFFIPPFRNTQPVLPQANPGGFGLFPVPPFARSPFRPFPFSPFPLFALSLLPHRPALPVVMVQRRAFLPPAQGEHHFVIDVYIFG